MYQGFFKLVFGSDLLSHGNPYYHRRWLVSLSCSRWEGVGPNRYDRQTKLLNQKALSFPSVMFVSCFSVSFLII